MSHRWLILITAISAASVTWADTKKPAPEPRLSSIHPLTGQAGKTYVAVIRGTELKGASAVAFSGMGVSAHTVRVEAETGTAAAAKSKADLLHVEISIDAGAHAGDRSFRVVTPD